MFVYWLPWTLFGSYAQNTTHTLQTFIRLAQRNRKELLPEMEFNLLLVRSSTIALVLSFNLTNNFFFYSVDPTCLPNCVVASHILYSIYVASSTVHYAEQYTSCSWSIQYVMVVYSPLPYMESASLHSCFLLICTPPYRTEQSARMKTGVSCFLVSQKLKKLTNLEFQIWSPWTISWGPPPDSYSLSSPSQMQELSELHSPELNMKSNV